MNTDLNDSTNLNADDAILHLFMDEAQLRSANIDANLLKLEKDPENISLITELMRDCHSLKGASRLVSLTRITDLAHKMEDFFVALQSGKIKVSPQSNDVLFACSDYIKALVANSFKRENAEYCAALIVAIDNILNEKSVNLPKVSPAQNTQNAADDDSIKVSFDYLNRLMSLSAESLIENRRIHSVQSDISQIKNDTQNAVFKIDSCILELEASNGSKEVLSALKTSKRILENALVKIATNLETLVEYSNKNTDLSDRLHSEAVSGTMRPISDILVAVPRMVRDLAKSLNKQIDFSVSGENSLIDRKLLKRLETCIMHIIRNACDHGIEAPQLRKLLGKPERGKISIQAVHSRSMFVLKIADDGAGIDINRLKSEIVAKGLSDKPTLDMMGDDEIYAFLFLPNFSMSEKLTQISGRGVGLDVVLSFLQEIGGSVKIESKVAQGTVFTLMLPISRSVLNCIIAKLNGQPYAFALEKILKTVSGNQAQISGNLLNFEGQDIEIINLKKELLLGEDYETQKNFVLIKKDKLYAMQVDELVGEAELVIRPLDSLLEKVASVWAYAIDNESNPVIILDTDSIINGLGKKSKTDDKRKRALLVEDSKTVREKTAKILKNIGYLTDTAIDGVDAVNAMKLIKYDIVVSDVDMPRMNGIKLVEKIRSAEFLKNIPVVLLSYKDSPNDIKTGMQAGATLYLSKNMLNTQEFAKTLRELLPPQ